MLYIHEESERIQGNHLNSRSLDSNLNNLTNFIIINNPVVPELIVGIEEICAKCEI